MARLDAQLTLPKGRIFITVIIPVLNAELHLDRCLESLTAQSYPNDQHEVIVVDNGSDDRSVEIAESYADVNVLFEGRPGAYNARNHGIGEARGEVLAFTDPDCVADRDWLSEVAAAMENPSVGLICGRRLPARRTWLISSLADYESTKDAFVLNGDREETMYGFSSNMGVKRELFETLGEFVDRPRGADALFARAVASERSSEAIRFAPRAMVTHLEFDNLPIYYKKVFLYGRHRQQNNSILRSRALAFGERMAIFQQTRRQGGYSPARGLALLALLSLGSLAWWLGATSARLR